MTTIPSVWLWISGLAYGSSIILNVVLVGVVFGLWKKMGPLLEEIRHEVGVVGDKADTIASKVVNITSKAENVASGVQDVADKAHDAATATIEIVSHLRERATGLFGHAEEESERVIKRVGAASATLTTAFLAVRIAGAVRSLFAGHHESDGSLEPSAQRADRSHKGGSN
jgi:hypothetical protein